MTPYARGANFEREVKKEMETEDVLVVRSAGSHGPVDLVLIGGNGVILVQCKIDGKISSEEEQALLQIGQKYQVRTLLAFKNDKGAIKFRTIYWFDKDESEEEQEAPDGPSRRLFTCTAQQLRKVLA
jgi:Holliday junction resolvase